MKIFVPFEIAKKLEEKGFKTKNTDWCYLDGDLVQVKKYVNISPYEYAPTISQVLNWLREKNIHLYTDIDNEGWFFEIKCLKTRFMINTDFFKRYSTYELAALAGIEYVIDNNLI